MKLIDMPPGRIVAGQVLWKGRDLVPLGPDEMQKIRAKEIAMIFQEPMTSLNPVYPVGEQIAESVRLHEGLSRREAMNRAVEMMRLVHIPTPERRERHVQDDLLGPTRHVHAPERHALVGGAHLLDGSQQPRHRAEALFRALLGRHSE